MKSVINAEIHQNSFTPLDGTHVRSRTIEESIHETPPRIQLKEVQQNPIINHRKTLYKQNKNTVEETAPLPKLVRAPSSVFSEDTQYSPMNKMRANDRHNGSMDHSAIKGG